jgi:uncharacterized membrane protein YeaQ/YmgE (transglycosylase-associated protein family)
MRIAKFIIWDLLLQPALFTAGIGRRRRFFAWVLGVVTGVCAYVLLILLDLPRGFFSTAVAGVVGLAVTSTLCLRWAKYSDMRSAVLGVDKQDSES